MRCHEAGGWLLVLPRKRSCMCKTWGTIWLEVRHTAHWVVCLRRSVRDVAMVAFATVRQLCDPYDNRWATRKSFVGTAVYKMVEFCARCCSLRVVAYRQYTWFIHGFLGKWVRKVIPACALAAICKEYPEADADAYHGFEEAGDDDGGWPGWSSFHKS